MALIDEPAKKLLAPSDLKVFAELPKDEKVTTVDKFFVPAFTAPAEKPTTATWPKQRDGWLDALRRDCFRAWPADGGQVNVTGTQTYTAQELRLTRVDFTSEAEMPLTLWILQRADLKPEELQLTVLNILDDEGWNDFRNLAATAFPEPFPGATPEAADFEEEHKMLLGTKWGMAYLCPRGTGPTSWAGLSTNKQTHLRRRLLLLGESLESGQVWDIRQSVAALRSLPGFEKPQLWLQAQKTMAANTLYASLFTPNIKRLDLHALPATQKDGPIYLNILRHLDLPQAAALAAERSTVAIYTTDEKPWLYARDVANALVLGEKRVQVRKPVEEPSADGR